MYGENGYQIQSSVLTINYAYRNTLI